jgi:hypothetical protein
MNRQIAHVLLIAILYSAAIRPGQSQTHPVAGAPVYSPPVIQAVAVSSGANIRAGGAGQGWLDLGHLMWAPPNAMPGLTHKKDSRSFSIATSFALRLDCAAADIGRSGAATASLQQSDARYIVFVDGIQMTPAPAMVSAAMLCGSTTQHSFEVHVPVTAAAGPISPNLVFEVTLR